MESERTVQIDGREFTKAEVEELLDELLDQHMRRLCSDWWFESYYLIYNEALEKFNFWNSATDVVNVALSQSHSWYEVVA